MIDQERLAAIREQVGLPAVPKPNQFSINNRLSRFDSMVQSTTPSVPEAPAVPVRHPIFDTLVQGVTAAKNRVAEAANNLPDPRTHEGAEQVEHLVGGFAGLGSNKVAGAVATKGAELLDKVLTEHITSSKQIIQNLPKEDFAQLGGMPALLDRTKINIADALKAYKLPEAEKEIRALDLSKFKSLDDFSKDVTARLGAHLKDHVETATEVQKTAPAFEGFSDLSTKLLESLKGRTTVSKQFIEEATNQAGLKQPEKDLIRRVLSEYEEGQGRGTGGLGSGVEYTPQKRTYLEPSQVSLADLLGKDGKITVYRGVDRANQKEIVGGDYVATSKQLAESYTGNKNVISREASLKDIYVDKGDLTADELKEYLADPENFHIEANYVPKPSNGTINVKDFANKVKSELLPLERANTDDFTTGGRDGQGSLPSYENITLPDELRGPVANYSQHIYESPIKTSAGGVHFSDATDNYFAHSRIEDLPSMTPYEALGYQRGASAKGKPGSTRRVIEIQSDLFQKGRLEGEFDPKKAVGSKGQDTLESRLAREAEIAKLEPYRNTWHERVIREEVKQAAKDGKTKLQFPTGETAMKIEGLGYDTNSRIQWGTQTTVPGYPSQFSTLKADDLTKASVGKEITRGDGSYDSWIITDVLGDGKFKAVPKHRYEYKPDEFMGSKKEHDKMVDAYSEEFDISGKVDKENPIFRFYDKEVAKYLKNKYGATQITDPQGVTWFEVNVKPEMKKLPIEAFGALAVPALGNPQAQVDKNDTIRP